ncbi:hypothetical protein BHE74_00057987 [Ensete ventricosum]|nr:hypothetical protein BHE74_00057987 [Ensete ventricosum]
MSFSVISVLTGITTLYNTGLEFGGPVTMIYGWPIAGAFTLLVGLAMSEICSAYPTSGGLYFWSAKLCGNRWGPFASWITGCSGEMVGSAPWSSDTVYLSMDLVILGICFLELRTAYAFSRDGAMPLSSFWHKVNKQGVPINAVWLSAFMSFCMALTVSFAFPYGPSHHVRLFTLVLQSLGSLVAFQAMVSIATVGLNIAYALPIFFRVTLARKSFVPGPFNLGRYSLLVGRVAVLWVATITVLFSLPVAYPITGDTLNYTPVLVGGLLLLTVASWLLSATHWFRGPTSNINT